MPPRTPPGWRGREDGCTSRTREFRGRARQMDSKSVLGRAACKRRYRFKPWIRGLGALRWHRLPNREKLEQGGRVRSGRGRGRHAPVLHGGWEIPLSVPKSTGVCAHGGAALKHSEVLKTG